MGKQVGEEKLVRRYSEALKRQVVEEIESGCLSVREAMVHYDIPWQRTVNRWQHKYGNGQRGTKIVRIVMKDEKERIRELEKLVADLEIRNMVKGAQVEILEEMVGGEKAIKKKLSTKQYEEYVKRKAKIKSH